MISRRFPRPHDEPRHVRHALSLVAAGVVAACITVMFWGMRSVMDVGGSCASGNTPFEIARPCPDGTWTMAVAVPLGVVAAFAFAILAPAGLRGLVVLAWSGLFLALGWNFLEYAFDPPGDQGGVVWGWLIPGILFVLMGALPFLAVVPLARGARDGLRMRRQAGRPRPPAPPPPPSVRRVDPRPEPVHAPAEPRRADPRPAPPPAAGEGGVVDRLERLAAMRRRGELTAEEYEDAKRLVLEEGDA